MKTVHEISRLAGVSERTLRYYDTVGLLRPTGYSESGYRLYDDAALERLQEILLFRELEFPLKDIRAILDAPELDRAAIFERQIALLTLKKERLEGLIAHARALLQTEVNPMDFKAFDKSKVEAYARQAKEAWGQTAEYREYEDKSQGRTSEEDKRLGRELMDIFREFAACREADPASAAPQALVGKLQGFISEHYYHCSRDVLRGLGQMYAAGGDFTANIDAHAGEGTAAYANRAIQIFCDSADKA